MKCLTTVTMAAASYLWIVVPSAGAQTMKDLVGTWYLVSDTNTASDGHTVQPFGLTPQGIAIFDSNGHFAIVNARSDLPQFASNNRMHGWSIPFWLGQVPPSMCWVMTPSETE